MPYSFQGLDGEKRSCLHIVVNHQNYKNVALHSFHFIIFLLQLKFYDEKKVMVIGKGVFTGFLPIY